MVYFSYAADIFQSVDDFGLLFFLLEFLDSFGASLSFEIEVQLLGRRLALFLFYEHVFTLVMRVFRFWG